MNVPKIYAHRGGAGYFVENTLKAFEFSIDLGCDGAELDVHLTKDGELVVHHDEKLNHRYAKVQDGNWISKRDEIVLNNSTLAELKKYTLGEPNPETFNHKTWPNLLPEGNQRLPTLKEVIELVQHKSDTFELIIELKVDVFSIDPESWRLLVDKVLSVVEESDFLSRVKLCGFNWNALLYAQDKSPNVPLWFTTHPFSWLQDGDVPKADLTPSIDFITKLRKAWNSGNAPWLAGLQPESFQAFPRAIRNAGGQAWFCYHSDITEEYLKFSKDNDVLITAWSVNLKSERALEEQKISDAVCLDYPNYQNNSISSDAEDQLAIADQARKNKNWEIAESIYQSIVTDFAKSNLFVYKGLAICQRMLGKNSNSLETLTEGLSFYPNNMALKIEEAALKNSEANWNVAADIWLRVIYNQQGTVSALNIERAYKSCFNANFSELNPLCFLFFIKILFEKEEFDKITTLTSFFIRFGCFLSCWVSCEIINIYNKASVLINRPNSWLALKENLTYDKEKLLIYYVETSNRLLVEEKILKSSLESIKEKDYLNSNSSETSRVFLDLLVHDGPRNAFNFIALLAKESGCLGYDFFRWVSQTFIFYGFLEFSIELRCYLAKLMPSHEAKKQTKSGNRLYEVGSSLFYLGKYNELENCFNEMQWWRWKGRRNAAIQMLSFAKLVKGEDKNKVFDFAINEQLSNVDVEQKNKLLILYKLELMNNLIENKKVLIIGPAPDDGSFSENEMRSYDVVVRLNSLYQALKPTLKTDLVYYNNPVFHNFKNSVADFCEASGAIPVFMKDSFVKSSKIPNARLMTPNIKGFLTERHSLHGVPRVLWEIMKFKPKEIKIINATFFITGYEKNYLNDGNKNLQAYHFAKSVGHDHDPYQSFIFAKALHGCGFFSMDEQGENAMRVSSEQYLDFLLEMNHSGFART